MENTGMSYWGAELDKASVSVSQLMGYVQFLVLSLITVEIL